MFFTMMSALRRRLAEPFPRRFGDGSFLPYALASGAFVFFFFLFIRPFGLWSYAPSLTVPLYAGFGLITTALMSLNYLIAPRLLPRGFREERWSLGRQALFSAWIILTVAVAAYVFTRAYSSSRGMNLNKATFGLVLLATFFIGSLLNLLFGLIKQNRALRGNLRIVDEANVRIGDRPAAATAGFDDPEVVLVAENGRDTFRARLADLLFIAAEENYVEIFHHREQVQRSLLRSSLTRVERQLRVHQPPLFRCHRAYLVNLRQIRKVEGNAQGLKLVVGENAVTVPVARRYIPEFRRLAGRAL
jgi:hypothetical protein